MPKTLKKAIHFIKYSKWIFGFETRKTWPNKPYFDAGYIYYDGHHRFIHLWGFYAEVEY